jgi:2,3-bisphosphoglycerate-independent phosphoglycerate mutase
MKCYEITDRLLPELKGGKYAFLRVNFPNGVDMVGNTGVLGAAIEAMNALDRNMGRIIEAARINRRDARRNRRSRQLRPNVRD